MKLCHAQVRTEVDVLPCFIKEKVKPLFSSLLLVMFSPVLLKGNIDEEKELLTTKTLKIIDPGVYIFSCDEQLKK